MASINSVVKRKQFIWLGIVLATVGVVGGGGWYLADARYEGSSDAAAAGEPAPDMTGVVDSTFDQKVQQHATTEMQATASEMQKQYAEMRRELELLSKGQAGYQHQIDKLSQDNAALSAQVSALGAKPVTASGEPAPQP
ncbi:TPA: conjugal transfer protein TraB, partial [Citrobacter freundii]|nr:conjugal transfer protein TraB [Citrobacter freundii]HCA1004581.1 conjugal transfer protein TraB [Citrobacter freundii]